MGALFAKWVIFLLIVGNIWATWFVADQVTLPFIVRAIFFFGFVLNILTAVKYWKR